MGAVVSVGPIRGPESASGGKLASVKPAKLYVVSDANDLVERCRSGDRGAFRELFHRHRDDVARLIRRLGASPADLEDLTQEVFLQVHRSITQFRGQSRLSTWLYRLTVNVVLMHRRAAGSRPTLIAAVVEPAGGAESAPDEQVARRRRIAAFYALLERLSDKKRAVFVLHELEGLTPADIAMVVGAPVLTVRTRLFYARREILQMMEDDPTLSGLLAQDIERERLLSPSLEKEST